MIALKKILVGVDPRQGGLSKPAAEAAKQAIWLAKQASAEITFLSAIDPPPKQDDLETLLRDARPTAEQFEAACRASLGSLIEQAQQQNVHATSKIAFGTGWIELMREAVDGHYDLVFVGTRNQGVIRRALFGSTAMKLLHNCPAPVWVTKPEPHPAPKKMLVTSDFSEVSEKALRLAVGIGLACGANMHLIHVVKEDFALLSDAEEEEARREESYHEQDIAAAHRRLQGQLGHVLADFGPGKISIAEDTAVADHAIAKYAESHQIDLLVLGTSARHGLAGVFVGNTAERLLPTVDCSLLVVKPDGFECPVCHESQHVGEQATGR
ncbi:MAG TPA: universal stress protein [Pirellulales bacterium]|nr:universal stress protein [Pirellulales bacterium]